MMILSLRKTDEDKRNFLLANEYVDFREWLSSNYSDGDEILSVFDKRHVGMFAQDEKEDE